jgi:hypothetical protein
MQHFDIAQLLNGNWTASNGQIFVASDIPCVMRKRRGINSGTGMMSEMLYVRLPNGNTVYIRPFSDGTITVRVTDREVYF